MTDPDRMEAAALGWVRDRFDFFNPLRQRSAKRIAFVTKAAAELATLCCLAMRTPRAHSYRDLAERIWREIFSDAAMQDYMLGNPGQVPCIGFYATMRGCGFEDAVYRRRLADILAGGYLAAIERTPSTQLDYVYNLMQAGFDAPDLAAVWRRTMLAQHPPVSDVTTDDAYTITHALFFTTDFARHTPPFFAAADERWFAAALPRLAGYWLRAGDWDLGAELLIALHAARVDAPVFATGWKLLLAAQREDGSYGGPLDAEHAKESEAHREREWVAFRDNYHTTLAVLLALVTAPCQSHASNKGDA